MPQAVDQAGNIWETDAQGNPVRLLQAAGQPRGQVLTLPPDPMAVAQNQRAQNADQRANVQLQLAQEAAARAAAEQNKAPAGYRWNANGGLEAIPGGPADPSTMHVANRPTLTAKERADALQGYRDAAEIGNIAQALREQYDAGPGATKGIAGLKDYLPNSKNRAFDDIGNRARGYVKRSLGFTGGEANTMAESSATYGPYIPTTSDYDTQIVNKIKALEELGAAARDKSIAILGGIPDANGNITPLQTGERSSVWQQTYMAPAQSQNAAGFGATQQAGQIPLEMQAELDGYIQKNARNLNSNELRQFIDGLYSKYGFNPNPDNEDWARQSAGAMRNGGTINSQIPSPNVPMSFGSQVGNNALNNPVSSGAINFVDALGMGTLNNLTGGRVQDVTNSSDANAIAGTIGQIGGAIAGTEGLGVVGRAAAAKVAPSLLGGGRNAALARSFGTDAAYSGVYGSNQGQDPLTSALVGTAGSVAGSAMAKGAGKAMEGLGVPEAVKSLQARGIPLTVGQALGGTAKRIEDAMTSIPYVGDIVNARRSEGLNAFNRQAFLDAGSRIGYTPEKIAQGGVDELGQKISNAYTQATSGVDIPLDPQLEAELAAIRARSDSLPPDLKAKFDLAMTNRVDPIVSAGNMTGDQYQQVNRSLAGYKAETSKPGFEADYRQALTDVQQAMRQQMERGGGADVVQALSDADAAYRANKVLQDAVDKAASGQQSGEVGMFTPNQLQRADISSGKKYGRNGMAFTGLTNDAQSVLPSTIPDSGTARRVTQMALPAALGGAGGGIGALSGGTDGAASGAGYGLALGALLSVAGTKGGQQLITSALTGRPESVAKLGRAVSKRRGMFGAGAIPLALPLAN